MDNIPSDAFDDARVEQLVQFDEALRLGRDPAKDHRPADPQLDQAQQFLRRLQSVWKRSAPKIGPYVLIRSLGQGSLGLCYLVEDPRSRQELVLKVLWPELSAHQQA